MIVPSMVVLVLVNVAVTSGGGTAAEHDATKMSANNIKHNTYVARKLCTWLPYGTKLILMWKLFRVSKILISS